MVNNQIMGFLTIENQNKKVGAPTFKTILAKVLALQLYMENYLGNVNSHLSLSVNKKKSYQNCFDLFHKLDDDV
jgi:hypothetical protein